MKVENKKGMTRKMIRGYLRNLNDPLDGALAFILSAGADMADGRWGFEAWLCGFGGLSWVRTGLLGASWAFGRWDCGCRLDWQQNRNRNPAKITARFW
jgi:hypothetical protein